MRLLKYLFRSITVLNALLIAVIVAWTNYTVSPLVRTKVIFTPPPVKKTEPAKEAALAQSQAPSPQDFVLIAEQNLFHPERKIPVEKAPAPPLPTPEFVLYGTLMTEDTSVAYMEDIKAPQSTAGRGKRQVALRKGETLSGFALKEIEAQKVVMVRGEESVTVNLNETQRPKLREGVTITPRGVAQQPPVAGVGFGQPQRTSPIVQPPVKQPAPQPAQPTSAERQSSAAAEEIKNTFLDFFKKGR